MLHRKGLIALVVLVFAAVLVTDAADAARLGGGRSFGAQRSFAPPAARAPAPSATAPGAASNPVLPPSAAPRATAPAAAAAAPGAAAAAAPRSGLSRWMGPIAGLAAGLGLAALMSHLGLSEAFGSFLLMALLAVGVVLVVRALLMRRSRPQLSTPNAYRSTESAPAGERAWGRTEPALGSVAAVPATDGRFPPGFDRDAFVRQAKMQFRSLQGAWDAGDRRALANVTTPEMYADIDRDLATRGVHQDTDVVSLEADVLEVTTEARQHWASVRFWGVLREDGGPSRSFDETWNLVKPIDDSSGWLLAGIQQNEPATAH